MTGTRGTTGPALRLVDAALYGGSAGGGAWLVATYLLRTTEGAAVMLAVLAAVAAGARVWRHGPPVVPVPARVMRLLGRRVSDDR